MTVGVVYSSTGLYYLYGGTRAATAKWWKGNCTCATELGIDIDLALHDVASNASAVVPVIQQLLTSEPALAMINLPEGPLASIGASAANIWNGPVFTGMDGNDYHFVDPLTGLRKHANLVGTMTMASRYFVDFYDIARREGARRLAFIEVTVNMTGFEAYHLMASGSAAYVQDAGLEIVYVGYLTTLDRATEETQMATLFPQLMASDPDVVVIGSANGCSSFQYASRLYKWRPSGVAVTECLNNLDTLPASVVEDLRGFFVPAQWHQSLVGSMFTDTAEGLLDMFPYVPGSTLPSAAQLYDRFFRETGLPTTAWNSLVATDLATYAIFTYALCSTNSTDSSTLLEAVHRASFPSYSGYISVNPLGLNVIREMPMLQLDFMGILQRVTPEASSVYQYVFPLPSYTELTKNLAYGIRPDETAVIATALFVVLISISIGLTILCHWASQELRAISPPLCLVNLIGGIMLAIAPLTWLNNDTKWTCASRWPLFTLGAALSLGSLSVKLIRLTIIFRLKRVILKDMHLMALLLVSMAAIPVPLLSYFIWAPSRSPFVQEVIPDAIRVAQSYLQCQFAPGTELAMVIYIYGLLAITLVLAIFTHVSSEQFQEAEKFSQAKLCIFVVYNKAVLLLVLLIVYFAVTSRLTAYNIRAYIVEASCLIDSVTLYVPRLIRAVAKSSSAKVHPQLRTKTTNSVVGV